MSGPRVGVLFVCLGNICRSPLAEAAFLRHAARAGAGDRFDVDSCGTGHWHAGEGADARSVAVARRNGVELDHCARVFSAREDVARFEWLIAMDRSNAKNLVRAGAPAGRVRLLRSFDPAAPKDLTGEGPDVPDPYYGGESGFDEVWTMVDAASAGLLAFLLDRD